MKTFNYCISIILLLFYLNFIYCTNNCTTNSECSNQGICYPAASGSYCTCYSGFGGGNCSIEPSSSCSTSYSSVNQTVASFSSSASLNFQNGTFTMSFTANLQENHFTEPWNVSYSKNNSVPYSLETIIVFGNGSYTNCNFPNGGSTGVSWSELAATATSCQDEYQAVITWSNAKTLCGFTNVGNGTYEQTVHVIRSYKMPTLRNQSVTSNETSTHILKIIFPTQITLYSSDIQVSGLPGLLAAITSINFNPTPTPEIWTLSFMTSVQAPYKLDSPNVTSVTSEISTNSRYENGSVVISNITPCNNNSFDCTQLVSLNFVKGSASASCDALSGSITVQFIVNCSQGYGSNCPVNGSQTATITVTLQTGNACPTTQTIQFSTATLTAFSNPSLTTSKTAFMNDQIIYFGATIKSTQATITNLTIQSNSVCFETSNTSICNAVTYNVLSNTNGYEPVFSVNLANNSNIFGYLNLLNATFTEYIVRVTILVQFSQVAKRSLNFALQKEDNKYFTRSITISNSGNQNLDIVTWVQIGNQKVIKVSSSSSNSSSFLFIFLYFLFSIFF